MSVEPEIEQELTGSVPWPASTWKLQKRRRLLAI